jgi:hypothetical protein
MLPWEMLNHPAYTKLPSSASKALPFFLGKPKKPRHDPEFYATTFSFSFREGGRHGFANGTFAKCIRDLMTNGFIDPVDKGGLRGDGKSCNKFKLSRRWEKFGTPEFIPVSWPEFQPPIPTARNSKI